MENVDKLHKKYYSSYESDYDIDDKLNKPKKKFDYKQFELVDKTDKEIKLNEETKDLKLTALSKWLNSKNDFKKFQTKFWVNDLEKLINDIRNNKVKKESVITGVEKSIAELEQPRQKESTVFQNKMIYVLYYLFNSFVLGEKLLLFNEKKQIN